MPGSLRPFGTQLCYCTGTETSLLVSVELMRSRLATSNTEPPPQWRRSDAVLPIPTRTRPKFFALRKIFDSYQKCLLFWRGSGLTISAHGTKTVIFAPKMSWPRRPPLLHGHRPRKAKMSIFGTKMVIFCVTKKCQFLVARDR